MREQASTYVAEDGSYGVTVTASALRNILQFCREGQRLETGGVLVGQYSADRTRAIVTAATGPAPDTRSGRTWLRRGTRGLAAWLRGLWRTSGQHYVGEWHFHPYAPPTPSGTDIAQMRQIAATAHYQCCEPILIILGGDPKRFWSLHVEVNTRAGTRHVLASER